MVYWVLALLFIIVVLVIRLMLYQREIRSINTQLAFIIEQYANAPLKMVSANKVCKELVDSINQFLILHTKLQEIYKKTDQQNRLMISSISHDFRTPLTSILGYIQILQDTEDPLLKASYLSIVEKRIESLSLLIEDFYALSLLESDEYPVKLEPVNPSLLLTEQIALYYHELNQTFNQVTITVSESKLTIMSDQTILQRILSNLIKNAIIHGVNTLFINYQENETNVIISFGNELAERDQINLERIFERTYRNDKSRHLSSTGLGLSITKQLSQLMGYQVNVAKENQIIVFKLIIPIKNKA